jgi:hypothetical protein
MKKNMGKITSLNIFFTPSLIKMARTAGKSSGDQHFIFPPSAGNN